MAAVRVFKQGNIINKERQNPGQASGACEVKEREGWMEKSKNVRGGHLCAPLVPKEGYTHREGSKEMHPVARAIFLWCSGMLPP